jgi:hypothetical protein
MPRRPAILTVFLATLLFLMPRVARAQEVATPKQIISISPISLVFGLLGAEYEHRLSTSSSWGVSGSVYRNDEFTYLATEAKWRYYPQEKALEGFSVGLTGGVTNVGTRNTTPSESSSALSLGFALDYQWLLGPKKKFAVTLGTGARRLIGLSDALAGANLTLPTFRISIGRGF